MSLCAYTSPPADTYIHACPFLCPYFQPFTSVILLTLLPLHFKLHHHQTPPLASNLPSPPLQTTSPSNLPLASNPPSPTLQTTSPSTTPRALNALSLHFKLHHHQTRLLLQTLLPCRLAKGVGLRSGTGDQVQDGSRH